MLVTPDMLVGEVGRASISRTTRSTAAGCRPFDGRWPAARRRPLCPGAQFHRAISDFQAVKFMLADMEIGLEASRLLLDRPPTPIWMGLPMMTASAEGVPSMRCPRAMRCRFSAATPVQRLSRRALLRCPASPSSKARISRKPWWRKPF
ncbi:MAG: acyl-CoA dehydrogenase family protein [Eggerthellaceae bacterium]